MHASEFSTYSKTQAITASASSTNHIYHGINVGRGNPVTLLVQVTTDFTGPTTATLTVYLLSTNTLPTGNLSKTGTGVRIDLQSAAVPIGTLKAGYQFDIDYYPQTGNRYHQILYEVANGPFTAGNITAEDVMARQNEGNSRV